MSDVSGFLTSERKPDRPTVSRRFGTVLAVNAGPPQTVDVELAVSGVTIPGVPILASYGPAVGDAVVVDFTDDTPLAIGASGGGRHGWLGAVTITASQTGITTETDLTGFSAPVTVGQGRRIKISLQVEGYSTVAADNLVFRIKEGATVLQKAEMYASAASNQESLSVFVLVYNPTAGAHTYKVSLTRATGTGQVALYAGADHPAFLLVEDIGPA